MRSNLPWLLAAIAACGPALALAAKPNPCVSTGQAVDMLHKDVCISAHVYNVVQISDGTRFLDVCPPQIPDAQCRFTVVSYWEDHDTVGDLQQYSGRDVRIRGTIEALRGRTGMILSQARQFHGGRPRFRPNPMLTGGFDAEQSRPPVSDPSLRVHGGRRGFMNTRRLQPLSAK
jgi:hypothetical protein